MGRPTPNKPRCPDVVLQGAGDTAGGDKLRGTAGTATHFHSPV